ncbi:MAG: F0F1 ATP synthase subunit B [Abditibacteriota bacterium]|nr:F0F1 ATP synthase subunit B [Abditibacteriota bacterium]
MKRVLRASCALTLLLACAVFGAEEEIKPIWQQGAVFLLQAVGFIITVLLLRKWLFVPVSNLFEQRKAEIEDNYLKSEAAKEAAEEKKREYEERLAGCEEEINVRSAAAAREAQKLAERTVRKAEEEAERRRKMAEDEIELEKEKAVKEVRDTAVLLGIGVAEKVLKENLTDEKNLALARDFVRKLDGEGK